MKICVECKWIEAGCMCTHPILQQSSTSLVTGITLVSNKPCEDERTNGRKCGAKGKLWEPKND